MIVIRLILWIGYLVLYLISPDLFLDYPLDEEKRP